MASNVAGPRGRWKNASALGLIALCLLAEALQLRVGVDDLDEGYFVQQALRVVHGQVPYRDFETFYTPGLAYLHAGLFAFLGGPSLIAVRLVALAARAALAVLLYALARPLVRQPLWAALPGVFLLIGLDDAPIRWEPHPGWLSTLFAVLAAWCLTRGRSAAWLVAAGLAAGGAYLFKQNTGVFILGAVLLWGLLGGSTIVRRTVVPLVAFCVVTLAWLGPLVVTVPVSALGSLVGAVNQAGLFSAPEPSLAVPLAALAGGLWLVRREADARLRWLLVAGTALLLTQYPRMDTLHLAWSAPLLLVIGALVLDRVPGVLAALALLGLIVVAEPTFASRLDYLRQPRAHIADVMAPVPTVEDLTAVIADIRQRTQANEPIFVYPTSPLLYVLADHPNPTRFDHVNPGAADARQIQQVEADLEAANVRLIVVSDYWRSVWDDPGLINAPLETWIEAHFAEVGRHGPYRVLAARL